MTEVDESEFMAGTVHELVAAIVAEEVVSGEPADGTRQTFVTTSPSWWGGNRTFGGMVVAQALNAACQTAPAGMDLHSLHGYFLRPSRPGSTSTHAVERVRDGRSFATREVTTSVEDRTTFRLTCSFHAPEGGDVYQLPLDGDEPRPDEIPEIDGPFPFDFREIGATDQREDGTYASTRRFWCRTRQPLSDDPVLHSCVLAYVSDMTGAAFRPLSLGTFGAHTDATLDYALWFHRPRRADVWNLFDMTTVVCAGGRSTMRSTMYGDDGTLYMSMAQELLIRELSEPITFDTPPWAEQAQAQIAAARKGKGAVDGTT